MAGTLYTYPENFRAYKVLIAAQYSGADVKIASDFVFGETNKTEQFLKKFKTPKVPVFETKSGDYISESNAIAYYVANEQLRGTTDLEKAKILQWISFADNEILPSSCTWIFPLLGIIPYNKDTVKRAKDDILSILAILNDHLVDNTFLVGERITLADIILFANLIQLYQYVLEPSVRAPFGSVTRWFTTILNQKQTLAVVKNFKLVDKAIEFDPKKYAEFQTKTGKVDTKPGKVKTPKAPKEQKPKVVEETPVEEELDAADEALAAEPPSKDPYETLPKSTFNFDTFKRIYSNEDESKSLAYFWDNFDHENCSIWYGEYKYNDELSKVFMSCNLISGMFQRLDKMRKNCISSVCLFGEDNDSTISGVWVWRGQDLAFELSPDWKIDYDCYAWNKLDSKSEATKELFNQYFSWTGTDKGGRKFNQGKVFK